MQEEQEMKMKKEGLQGEWEERIRVDPDLAILPNMSNLHPDLIGMAHNHDLKHIIPARVRVHHHPGMTLELVDLPLLGHEPLKHRLQHPECHGSLMTNWTGRRQDPLHPLKLLTLHWEIPRSPWFRWLSWSCGCCRDISGGATSTGSSSGSTVLVKFTKSGRGNGGESPGDSFFPNFFCQTP